MVPDCFAMRTTSRTAMGRIVNASAAAAEGAAAVWLRAIQTKSCQCARLGTVPIRKRHHHPHFPGRKGDFLADKSYTHAPNLKRCAVVSPPERDIAGEPIAARLNKNVGDALAAAKEDGFTRITCTRN